MSAERAVHKSKAHVFQIDPNTRKQWKPCATSSVPVGIYHDAERDFYRIVAMQGSTALVNSHMRPGMIFTKTAQKFGQWPDVRANTHYGLGFGSEQELNEFADAFAKAVDALSGSGAGSSTDPAAPPPTAPKPEKKAAPAPAPTASSTVSRERERADSDAAAAATAAVAKAAKGLPMENADVASLKYENERLKKALETSNANKSKWESELTTLRNTNVRLTTALQDSAKNVEQWKTQLAAWKEETTKLRRKVKEKEEELRAHSSSATHDLQDNLDKAREEVKELTQQASKLKMEKDQAVSARHELEVKVQMLERQKKALEAESGYKEKYEKLLEPMVEWRKIFGSKVAELDDLHSALGELLTD